LIEDLLKTMRPGDILVWSEKAKRWVLVPMS
jgi:hypothetical protein